MAGSASGIRAGKAYVELGGDDSPLKAVLAATEGRLKAFGAGLASIGAKVAGLGVAVATPLALSAKMFADAGSELNDMSARTGMSVEALSALGHAATQTGTDLETVEGAVRKMQKNLTAATLGNDQATVAFEALGLSIDRLSRLSPDQQFDAVAKAIGRVPDPTAKAAAAMMVLGKSGTALLPMIGDMEALTGEAKRLGLVMSGEDAAAADELGDAMDNVAAVVKRVAINVGAALAPMLTSLAGTLTDNIVAVSTWIRANQQVIVTVAKVAAGLVVAGGVMVALGGAIYGIGAAIGVVTTLFGAVATVIGAVLSPVGLLTVALAAGTYAFLNYTEVGGKALAWLGERFGALKDFALSAFKGMSDALAAGDILLAAKILWAGLKVAWLTGTNYLQQIWSDWGLALKQVVADLQTAIAGVFLDISSAVQIIWYDLTSSLTGTWGDMIGDFVKALIPLKDVFAALGVDIRGAIDDSLKILGFSVTSPEQRQAARDKAVGEIGQQNIDARAALASGADSETEARRKAAQDALAKSAADLAAAQADFAALTGEADNLRRVLEASTPGDGKVKAPAFDPGEIDTAITDAKAKIDVAGSFNAAALSGLAAGDSLANDQLKEQKKATTQLEKLNRKADTGRLVFTA